MKILTLNVLLGNKHHLCVCVAMFFILFYASRLLCLIMAPVTLCWQWFMITVDGGVLVFCT